MWTLENLVEAIRAFPEATLLILQSKKKNGISPDEIKRILFCLLVKGALKLNYHEVEEKAVFSLTHSLKNSGNFALMEDEYWSGINLRS